MLRWILFITLFAPLAHAQIQEMTLLKQGEIQKIDGSDLSIKITRMEYSPCPEGAQCAWSGLALDYEVRKGNELCKPSTVLLPAEKPYPEFYFSPAGFSTYLNCDWAVEMVNTDYHTYAKFQALKLGPVCLQHIQKMNAANLCKLELCKVSPKVFGCLPTPTPNLGGVKYDPYDPVADRANHRKILEGRVDAARPILVRMLYSNDKDDGDCKRHTRTFKKDWCFLRLAVLQTKGTVKQHCTCNKIESDSMRHTCGELWSEMSSEQIYDIPSEPNPNFGICD